MARSLMDELKRELSFRGVAASTRDDLVQDILIWALTLESPPTRLSRAFVRAVVRRFLRFENAKKYQRRPHEQTLSDVREPADGRTSGYFEVVAISDWLGSLPPLERQLGFALMEGATWREAFENLGVPPGSHSFWRSRLRRRYRASLCAIPQHQQA